MAKSDIVKFYFFSQMIAGFTIGPILYLSLTYHKVGIAIFSFLSATIFFFFSAYALKRRRRTNKCQLNYIGFGFLAILLASNIFTAVLISAQVINS